MKKFIGAARKFENDVKAEGTKPLEAIRLLGDSFENDVKAEGTNHACHMCLLLSV